jgi:hypothetical protein
MDFTIYAIGINSLQVAVLARYAQVSTSLISVRNLQFSIIESSGVKALIDNNI